MNTLWQKIKAPSQNLALKKTSDSENAHIPKPGDSVLHSSGAHGVVTAVETIGNVQTLSIECADGRKLRGLDRREFTLASPEVIPTPVVLPAAAVAAPVAPTPVAEPMPKIEGDGISPESILDELA
jgi:hypothetical protein